MLLEVLLHHIALQYNANMTIHEQVAVAGNPQTAPDPIVRRLQ
jgi:hypothetical protein